MGGAIKISSELARAQHRASRCLLCVGCVHSPLRQEQPTFVLALFLSSTDICFATQGLGSTVTVRVPFTLEAASPVIGTPPPAVAAGSLTRLPSTVVVCDAIATPQLRVRGGTNLQFDLR